MSLLLTSFQENHVNKSLFTSELSRRGDRELEPTEQSENNNAKANKGKHESSVERKREEKQGLVGWEK